MRFSHTALLLVLPAHGICCTPCQPCRQAEVQTCLASPHSIHPHTCMHRACCIIPLQPGCRSELNRQTGTLAWERVRTATAALHSRGPRLTAFIRKHTRQGKSCRGPLVAVSYAHGASSHCLEAASQACTARLPMANLRNQTNPGLICVLAEGKA